MSFGSTPLSTTTIGANQFPVSAVAIPGHAGGNLTALRGANASTDSNGNELADASMYIPDGNAVTLGISTDANTVNSVMGRLTKIRDLLLATLTISGTVTSNAGTGPFPTAGMIASGGTNANNPVKTGGVFNTTQPTVTNGQIVDAQYTARGAAIVATGVDPFAVNASQTGTWTVQPGNTANTTPWLVSPQVASSGGSVPYHTLSAASTNFTIVKAVACQMYGFGLSNTSGSAIFVKFYDKISTPATTDTPKHTVQVPANGTVIRALPFGMKFVNGFGWAATGGVADSDNTAIAANCVIDFDLNS